MANSGRGRRWDDWIVTTLSSRRSGLPDRVAVTAPGAGDHKSYQIGLGLPGHGKRAATAWLPRAVGDEHS
jgi:hypothetical protein